MTKMGRGGGNPHKEGRFYTAHGKPIKLSQYLDVNKKKIEAF